MDKYPKHGDRVETPVTITGPISLPTGAATESKQDTQITALGTANSTLADIDSNTDGLESALSDILTELQQKLEPGDEIVTAPSHETRSDTFTVPASGVAITLDKALKSYSIQVKGTGGEPTNWTVELQGSLDGVNYAKILEHKKSTGDGEVLFSGAVLSPSLYFKSQCTSLTLGPASDIVVTILGME